MGSNGFILVCYDVFDYVYVGKYLELFDFFLLEDVVYIGGKCFMEIIDVDGQ